jgi:hypothetical protein
MECDAVAVAESHRRENKPTTMTTQRMTKHGQSTEFFSLPVVPVAPKLASMKNPPNTRREVSAEMPKS